MNASGVHKLRYTDEMDDLASALGFSSFGVVLGAILGYLIRLLLEQQMRKQLEDHKHALTLLATRLDFLH